MLDWFTMALASDAAASSGEAVEQNKSLEERITSLEKKVDEILEIVRYCLVPPPKGKKK